MKVKLKPFQDRFVFSHKKFPAFVGGWGTGKSMSLIARAMMYSELIPDNLGIIFRKEYTDLRDSTVKDFQKYTGLMVNSQREVILPNKSVIMFRHIEELNNIQNVNLGWFAIEQGDELDGDSEFFMLFGRLRRQLEPTEEFKELGLPERTGFVIANAGDHWMKPLWKEGNLDDSSLSEATTHENADILPKDFLEGLETLKKNKPEAYSQFVLNDWSVSTDQYTLIKPQLIDLLETTIFETGLNKKVISCDPSQGGDECVIYAMENNKKIDEKILHVEDTMKIVGELLIFGNLHGIKNYAVDAIGIGAGICDRLEEMGEKVFRVISSQSATDKEHFHNKRAEMWGYICELIYRRELPYIEDAEIRKQLTSVRYDPKAMNSQGYLKLENKQETKKRLTRSPDRADAFVYGVWATKEIKEEREFNFEGFRNKNKKAFTGAAGW